MIEKGRQLLVNSGETVELECEAQGYPSPNVVWMSDGVILAKNSVNSGRNSHEIRSKLILVIPSVKEEKKYTCFAKNQYGNHQEVIDVKVAGSPSTAYPAPPGTSGKVSSKKDGMSIEIIIVIVACKWNLFDVSQCLFVLYLFFPEKNSFVDSYVHNHVRFAW